MIKVAPTNSSLHYDIIVRQENRPYHDRQKYRWNNFNSPTFVMLNEGADMKNFDHNLSKFADKYMGENVATWDLPEDLSEDIVPFSYQYSKLTDKIC